MSLSFDTIGRIAVAVCAVYVVAVCGVVLWRIFAGKDPQ